MFSLKQTILLMGLVTLLSSLVEAKTYNSWHLLYSDTYGVIKKIKEPKKNRTVIEFHSKTSRDTYINGAKTGKKAWNNKQDKIIRWDFNFNKSFVIIVSVKTKDGYRDLIYTSGEDNGNLYFGLGKYIVPNTWQTITRDLEKDLHKHEPHNQIISVNAFLIRGSGKIAKVEMLIDKKKKPKSAKCVVKPKVEIIAKKVEEKIKKMMRQEQREKTKKEKAKKIIQKSTTRDKNSFVPIIRLEEGDMIYHKLGEPFFDPGATAIDYDGVDVDVDVIGEVNINRVNRYVLTYIATDENGYTTTKARVVMVYKAGEGVKKEKVTPDEEERVKLKLTEEEIDYEDLLDLTPLDASDLDEDLLYYN